MHRHQVLRKDLRGRPVAVPFLYAGAIERTSFAEKEERKGYMTIDIEHGDGAKCCARWQFHELPVRPMVQLEIAVNGMDGTGLVSWLKSELAKIPVDSIVQIKAYGQVDGDLPRILRAESMRSLTPKTMNVEIVLADYSKYVKATRSRNIT
jgi:DNA repair exonuclease SbcCD nuclease subunit